MYVEEKDIPKWNDRFTIIKKLRKLRKKQGNTGKITND